MVTLTKVTDPIKYYKGFSLEPKLNAFGWYVAYGYVNGMFKEVKADTKKGLKEAITYTISKG